MPRVKYGIGYKGGKGYIAESLLSHIPSAQYFVDLFAGGCAMSHAAMLSGRFNNVIANDIVDSPKLFVDAINGAYDNECRWISREDFYAQKDTDIFIRLMWSYGNNGRHYICSAKHEKLMKALFWAVCFRDPTPLREYGVDASIAICIDDRYKRWIAIKRLCATAFGITMSQMRCSPVERIMRLRALAKPPRGVNISVLQKDYADVCIPDGSAVYADPPYKGCDDYYGGRFDHDRFYNYCRESKQPIYISELAMPDDFVCIAEIKKQHSIDHKVKASVVEKLFIHTHFNEAIKNCKEAETEICQATLFDMTE